MGEEGNIGQFLTKALLTWNPVNPEVWEALHGPCGDSCFMSQLNNGRSKHLLALRWYPTAISTVNWDFAVHLFFRYLSENPCYRLIIAEHNFPAPFFHRLWPIATQYRCCLTCFLDFNKYTNNCFFAPFKQTRK